MEKLESLSLKANTNATVTIADTIPVNHDDGFLKYLIHPFAFFYLLWYFANFP